MFTSSLAKRSQRAASRIPVAFFKSSFGVGHKILAVSLGLSMAAISSPAYGATSSWTGAADASWGDANWSPAAPGTGDTVLFGPLATTNLSTTLAANTTIAGLQVTGASGSVTIGNSGANTFGLTIGANGIDLSSADQNNLTINTSLSLSGSTNQIWNVSTGRTLTLNSSTLTRNAGATLNIQGSGTVAAPNIANVNGILGAWATIGSGTSLSYATVSGGVIVPLTGAASFVGANSATTNYTLAATYNLAAQGGSRSANTIQYTGGTGAIEVKTNRHLQLSGGLINAGTGTLSITENTSGGDIDPLGSELIFETNTQNLVIAAPILDTNYGASPALMTFASQGGTITLSAANTYTGGTVLTSGILALGLDTALSTGPLTITSGTLTAITANRTLANNITLSGAGTITPGSGFTFTANGIISGAGSLTKGASGGANDVLTLAGANTYSGGTAINGGTLATTGVGTLGSTSGSLTITSGTLDMASTSQGVGALNGSGGKIIDSTASTTSTLTIGNNNATGGSYAGVIANNAGSGGTVALTKTGTGTQTLTGLNTYTGATNVNGGTLTFAGKPTGPSTIGSISVADGATLGVTSGATGQSVLSLGSNSLTLGTSLGSTLAFNFNSLGNPTVPLISMATGTLTLSGSLSITVSNAGALTNGTINLINYGTLAGGGTFNTASFSLGPRSNGVISNNTATDDIVLTVTSDTPKWTGLDNGNWVVGSTGASDNWKLVSANTATNYIEGDNVLFDDTASASNRTINISAANVSPSAVTFNTSDGNGYLLTSSGGYGIAGSASLTKNGTGTVTITTANTYTGLTTIGAGTLQLGNGTADGTIASTSGVTDNGVLAYDWINNHTAGYAISGSGSVTKTGTGGLTLSGANSYSGNTTISAGLVTVGNATALGNGFGTVSVASGAALDLSGVTMSATSALTLSGTGISGGGALTNSNAATATYAGPVSLGADSSIVAANGSIILSNAGGITGSGFNLTLDGAGTGSSIAGIIATGAGGLTKNGSGTWTLAGGDTYGGNTTVNAGTLVLNQGNTISGTINVNGATLVGQNTAAASANGSLTAFGTSPINLNNGGALELIENASAYNLNFALANNVIVSGTATVDVTNSNSHTGQGYFLNTLELGANSLLNVSDPNNRYGRFGATTTDLLGNATIADQAGSGNAGAALNLQAITVDNSVTTNSTTTLTLNGSNIYAYASGALSNNASDPTKALALVKAGTGTVALDAADTFTGGTTLNAGTLVLGNATALGAATNAALTFGASSTGILSLNGNSITLTDLNTNATVGTPIIQSNSTTAGTDTLTVNTVNSDTFAGVIRNGLSRLMGVTKAGTGTLTLSGNNTYTGATIVTAGTLIVNGSLSGAYGVDAQGGTLGGNGTIVGLVTIDAGATLAPGIGLSTTAVMTLGNDVIFGDSSFLKIDLDNTNDVSDELAITGGLDIGNSDTLTLTLLNSTPTTNSFVIATYAGTYNGGTFATVNNLPAGYQVDYTSTPGEILIDPAAVPEPGTWSLMAGGLGMLAILKRSRRRRRA